MKTLWILGNQLSKQLEGFQYIDPQADRIVMIEANSRSRWKKYHKKKLVLIFSAMRHFAKELQNHGFQVEYYISESFGTAWKEHLEKHKTSEIILHLPTDWKMRKLLEQWIEEQTKNGMTISQLEENLFLVKEEEWNKHLPDSKTWKLDGVYQKLRRQYKVLLEGDKPIGGKWSFDAENRKSPKPGLQFAKPLIFSPDDITREVIEKVNTDFPENPGTTDSFHLPVTRAQAEEVLEHFLRFRLQTFGEYQDAMLENNPYMSHSLISSAMNIGLLDPLHAIRKAEEAYQEGKAPLAAVEGFIRQILGWREYIRGIYLRKMPDYKHVNAFQHERPLPDFFWWGDTKMNCLHHCVKEVLQNGYNHHIQRLMVLGNFANVAGIQPQEVAEWFNVMYTDAHDWVVLPNVLGMALYADHGTMSTKPYISSGQYINKMSNYCKGCRYQVSEKFGESACPFNSLYWDFLMRHQEVLRDNPRMGLMYQLLDKMEDTEKAAIKEQACNVLERLERGEL